jgi:hypothetical protein
MTAITYRINDRDGFWVDVNEHDGDEMTGRYWSCDNMEQAEQVAARLAAGLPPWDGPSVALIDPMDDCNESFRRGVATAGEWDGESIPLPF